MTSKLKKYFSEEAAKLAQRQIEDSGGNEVFFVGHLNRVRQVTSVEVFCRGNEFEVPALLQVARQGNVVIHNHPGGVLRPSSADTHIASILGNDGIGFYIVNNEVTDVYAMVEPFAEKKVRPIDSNALAKLFDNDGPISKKLDNYEFRPQQIEMMKVVSQAINEDKIAIVEAGTGTGKTLAYLLPAITYAVGNQERIVISTNTINLQEQLVNKDLPFLQSVFAQKFKAVLVKGRTNYACKRKLMEADQDLDLFSEQGDKSELKTILDWAKTTKDGSKSDLNIEPRYDVWEKIQSESDTSLKTKCSFYNECFFYTARRKAAVADVLVANHHLLFSDLAVRAARGASENAILPTYDRIVLDEAHNVEEVATSYFGTRVTSLGLLRMLGKLHRKKGSDEKGLLIYLSGKLMKVARRMPHEDFLKIQEGLQESGASAVAKLTISLAAAMDKIFEIVAGSDAQARHRGDTARAACPPDHNLPPHSRPGQHHRRPPPPLCGHVGLRP
ncbi:DEAD/DEAH box helicase family protein [candidate division KSB1 bacterium]|nr:DEAD/DEAH box helicase family protein [candidate division KSB1 bacterium]